MDKGNPNNLVIFTPPPLGSSDQAPLLVRNGGFHTEEQRDREQCRYLNRFKKLALVQIVLGILLLLAGLYFHIPVFSGGLQVLQGEDRLWYGTWIGSMNLLVGCIGRLASKRSLTRSVHKFFRRCYFIINASLCLYCNGIGITSYVITLSRYSLIQPLPEQRFTTVMAFICLGFLIPLFLINIIATVYQALATRQCKCWVCDPKNAKRLILLKQGSVGV